MKNQWLTSGLKSTFSPQGLVRITVVSLLTVVCLTLFLSYKQAHVAALEREIAQLKETVSELSTQPEFAVTIMHVDTGYAPASSLAKAPLELRNYFYEMGGRYGIEPELLAAIAEHESGFNTRALSSAGAMGLMGLMPITVRHLSARHGLEVDPWDPREAVKGAAAYLRELQSRFQDDQVLAAYNLGPTRLRRLEGDYSGFNETTTYVAKIQGSLRGTLRGQGLRQ